MIREKRPMKPLPTGPLRWSAALSGLLIAGSFALAQDGPGGAGQPGAAQPGAGQGGLSPDTPTLAPGGPGVNAPAAGAGQGPRTPLPPRDAPRAPQPGQSAGDGPKTPLPPRDTPRAAQPGQATSAQVSDWPCVQVKVPTLSYGQMWGGPPLEEAFKTWRDDKDVDRVVDLVVARRTKIEDAKAEIAKFAKAVKAEGGDRADAKLMELFAGVFEEINDSRSQIVSGIERYSRKQRELSERIKVASLKIAEEQKGMAGQNTPEAQKEREALDWDTRIYDERSQSLTFVCETPVILEQRAFELGREIQSYLGQSNP